MIRVYLVWGLRLQDRRKCHFTDYKCKGETVFDDDFDMNLPECQTSLLVSTVIVTSYTGVGDRGLGEATATILGKFCNTHP